MNKPRYFDKYQLMIAIIAVATTLISTILFIVMLFTSTITYDESGVMSGIIYNNTLQMIYSMFLLAQLTAIVWFIARTITYKMRIKEEDVL